MMKPFKALNQLTKAEKAEALAFFRQAVAARIEQWNNEAGIEGLLLGEVELDIPNWAAFCDDPEQLTLRDLEAALGEQGKGAA